jgi:hypothetical protein
MIHYKCLNKQCNFEEYYDKAGNSPNNCPECGRGSCRLTFCKERKEKKPFVGIGYKDNPRWSWSMGVNVQDIPTMMKKYPDRQYHPKTGQLLVKSRPHKKRLMKQHGMYEMS